MLAVQGTRDDLSRRHNQTGNSRDSAAPPTDPSQGDMGSNPDSTINQSSNLHLCKPQLPTLGSELLRLKKGSHETIDKPKQEVEQPLTKPFADKQLTQP